MKNPARVKSLQRAMGFEAGIQTIFSASSLLSPMDFVTGSHEAYSKLAAEITAAKFNFVR